MDVVYERYWQTGLSRIGVEWDDQTYWFDDQHFVDHGKPPLDTIVWDTGFVFLFEKKCKTNQSVRVKKSEVVKETLLGSLQYIVTNSRETNCNGQKEKKWRYHVERGPDVLDRERAAVPGIPRLRACGLRAARRLR